MQNDFNQAANPDPPKAEISSQVQIRELLAKLRPPKTTPQLRPPGFAAPRDPNEQILKRVAAMRARLKQNRGRAKQDFDDNAKNKQRVKP